MHQNLSGKYRVSYISSKYGAEFDFLKKINNCTYDNGIYCFVGEPKKISLFYSNSELNDFYITNGNLKNCEFECISYISDERVRQDAKEFLGPITLLPSSSTEGESYLDVIGNSFTNLPKPIDEYIRRPLLEKELESALNEIDRFPIITLLGRGGIGKTTLALNVINNITDKDRFDLIIWFSSRDIDLLVDGPKQVQTKVLNQKDISREFYSVVDPSDPSVDKIESFSKEMTKSCFGKALYVFDNFETLTNPLEVYEWINTYIRNPNKVLITSRISRNFKADYPIEVSGMTEFESKELIALCSKKLQISHLITPNYVDELIEESDGHPYILKILLGEIAKTKKLSKIDRIIADQDKILSALFKRTFNSLTPAAKRVFLTLCSWNAMIPVVAIEAVLWRPENEKMNVTTALDELRKCSFIDFIDNNSESIISVPLAASVYGKSELEVYPEKIKILEDRKLLIEFGVLNKNNLSSGIIARVENKFKAVASRITSIEQFKKEIPTLEYIANKFPKSYYYIAQVFEEYDDYEMTKYYLREYLKTFLLSDQKALLWLKLANICRSSGDWEGESHALSELVIIDSVPFEKISEAANRINNYFYYHPEERHVDYKKALLDKIIDVMQKRITEGNPDDYSRLGWLLMNNDKVDIAQEIVLKGLKIDETNSHCIKLLTKLEGLY